MGEAFVTPNLGGTERWVPYHTAFGVHEHFLIESIHHRVMPKWDEKRRFTAIFIFRAHCKRDFFNEAQLPHLLTDAFWKDPLGAFRVGGPLEKSMLEYRRKTKKPLLTLCFRMIPERILKDDDENLVRSILLRTQQLLMVGEKVWPIIKDKKTPAAQKFDQISELVQQANGLGETWAKMLMVCVDLAYPDLGLLESHCDVGVGALAPLRALLQEGGDPDAKKALMQLVKVVNSSTDQSSKHFWTFLPKVEQQAREKFSKMKLFHAQLATKKGGISAVTLQVQLCEYRQFRHALARSKYGLDLDETMKNPERERRLRFEDTMEFNEKTKRLSFLIPAKDDKPEISFDVSVQETNGSRRLAERIAMLCFEKLTDGVPKKQVETFRAELYVQCRGIAGSTDAPEDHCAWQRCKASTKHPSPLVSWSHQTNGGEKFPFQTTVKAAGGLLQAEYVARLCFLQLEAGKKKLQEAVRWGPARSAGQETQDRRHLRAVAIAPGSAWPRLCHHAGLRRVCRSLWKGWGDGRQVGGCVGGPAASPPRRLRALRPSVAVRRGPAPPPRPGTAPSESPRPRRWPRPAVPIWGAFGPECRWDTLCMAAAGSRQRTPLPAA